MRTMRQRVPFGQRNQVRDARAIGGSEPQVQAGSEKHMLNPNAPQTALRIYASSSLRIPDNELGKDNMINNIYLEPTVKPPVPGSKMNKFMTWLKTGKVA